MGRRVHRRRALVMADQCAASLSNIVVGIFVARALPAEGFGSFGLAWVAYLLALGACRALVGEPLLSLYSHESSGRRVQRAPDLLGATLTLSLALAAIVLVVGLVLDGAPAATLLALCPVLPVVLLQDTWRFMFIIDKAGVALALDLAWLVTVCLVLTQAPNDASPGWFVVAWGLSAVPGLVLAALVGGPSLSLVRPLRWLHEERATGSRFFGEFVSAQAAGQITLAVVGGAAGMAALAAVRSSQILYGPLNTLHAGIYLAVVPDGARVRSDPPRLMRLASAATAIIVGAAAVWTLACLAMPSTLGEQLFGATWSDGQSLVLPMGLAMIAGSAATGGFAGVRSLGDARSSMRARLASLPGELVLPIGGAVLGGALGFAVGLLLARVVSAAVWWTAFVTHGDMACGRRGDEVAGTPTLVRR